MIFRTNATSSGFRMVQFSVRNSVYNQQKLCIYQFRNRSWTNPLSRFTKLKKDANRNHIIEETSEIPSQNQNIHDLRHYVRANDMPSKLKSKLLRSKLKDVVIELDKLDAESIKVINGVFLELYKLNGKKIAVGNEDMILSTDNIIRLFEKSSKAIIEQNTGSSRSVQIPKYMSVLTQFLLKQKLRDLPPSTLVSLVELGSTTSSFEVAVRTLVSQKGHYLSEEFINELISAYKLRGKLDLHIFEVLASSVGGYIPNGRIEGKEETTLPQKLSEYSHNSKIIGDQFYGSFNEYIESLFGDKLPNVHEYEDLERNIDRIQSTTNLILSNMKLEDLSSDTLVQMVKLSQELSTVSKNELLESSIMRVLFYLNQLPSEQIESFVRGEDEVAIETLLELIRSKKDLSRLANNLFDSIAGVEGISSELKFQSSIYKLVSIEKDETALLQKIKEQLELVEHEDADFYTRMIQALMTSSIEPRGEFIDQITKYYKKNFHYEPSVLSHSYRLDKAISKNDHIQAINIFEDSLEASIQWSGEPEPRIANSLNELVIVLCKNMDDISSIFPIFTKIKQQLGGRANIDTIRALSSKMLEAEYIGDLVEMLKRELPSVDKESVRKLPLEQPWAWKYRQLFDQLHSFVINYTKEETFETNWVLYGELHKYFHVPYESYLPAMEFFCKKDRLNAALLIFRQVRKWNELHGDHTHLPPSRDMYMMLLKYFGDSLYEEGVIEIHENLKMDLHITNQDIELQNCVLNAYSNLQDVARARELFLSMSTNAKQIGGVNEESIQIMIKTYTYYDLAYVQKFWNNLSQFNIIPNRAIYRQFLIAHVYHGLVKDALTLIEGMADYDLEVDKELLLSLHNYCLEERGQKEFKEWAEENHKEIWDEVVQSGLLVGATNYAPSNNLIAGTNVNSV